MCTRAPALPSYEAFRHVENLFIQGLYLLYKDRYWLYNNTNLGWINKKNVGWINFLQVERSYRFTSPLFWVFPKHLCSLSSLHNMTKTIRRGTTSRKYLSNYCIKLSTASILWRQFQHTHISFSNHQIKSFIETSQVIRELKI